MPFVIFLMSLMLAVASGTGPLQAAPFPEPDGAKIIQQAMLVIEPSLVRIETIGGIDVLAGELTSSGPTTGVIVSADGYIITSSFNFAANPASIIVTLPAGERRVPAEVVATDHLKQLTLLKVEAEGLRPAPAIDPATIKVGQWALALGRTYDAVRPNVSLGLISATERIEGKAIQTDAKVSPANYGGPLIGLDGKVFGILAPLSPGGKNLTEGKQWYDSGIGFAIPLQEIYDRLETLQSGEDLHDGLMGVSFSAAAAFLTSPEIQEVRPNSPAAEAGLKKGDQITQIDSAPVSTVSQLKQRLGSRYAGDTISLSWKRGEETLQGELKLVQEIESYEHGWGGFLLGGSVEQGISLRYVFPESPAAKAGLQTNDRILAVNQQPVQTAEELTKQWLYLATGEEVSLKIKRGEEEQEVSLTLSALPENVATDLPQPVLLAGENQANALPTGDLKVEAEESRQAGDLYVPDSFSISNRYGLLIWMPADGQAIPKEQQAEWKRIARTRGFLILSPQKGDLQAWSTDDLPGVLELVKQIQSQYQIAVRKTMLVTGAKAPTLAWQTVFENRDRIGGLISFTLPAELNVPFNTPENPLRICLLTNPNDPSHEVIPKVQEVLKKRGYACAHQDFQETPTQADFDQLGGWLEYLISW